MCWQCRAVEGIGPIPPNKVTGMHLIETWFWFPRMAWNKTYLAWAWGCFAYFGY